MQHYRITPPHDQTSELLSFEAANLTEALERAAANHHATAPVELWCDGKLLGRLEIHDADEGSFWRLV